MIIKKQELEKKVLECTVNCKRQSFVFDLFKGRDVSMESYKYTSFLVVLPSNPLLLWDVSSFPFLNKFFLFTSNPLLL